jgi:hypothetical protein
MTLDKVRESVVRRLRRISMGDAWAAHKRAIVIQRCPSISVSRASVAGALHLDVGFQAGVGPTLTAST